MKGTVVVVTGASRGIGRATSVLLAEKGAKLVLTSRDRSSLEKLQDSIDAICSDSFVVPTDVRIEKDVKSLVTEILGKFGRIDALINNAGVGVFGPILQTNMADWERVIDTNLKGVYLCTRHFLPVMIKQGCGHIINVASQAGLYGLPRLAIYCASKFGVVGFSKALRRELAGSGVEVSYICPGYTDTDLLKIFPEQIRQTAIKAKPEMVATQIVNIIMSGETTHLSVSRGRRLLRRLRKIWRR